MNAADNKHDFATGWVMMRWSDLDPSFGGVNVVAQTEKAVRLQAETSKCAAWFPKSGFKMDKYGAYLPAAWLRQKMSHYEMKALGYAS
jgi:hypothetical protein